MRWISVAVTLVCLFSSPAAWAQLSRTIEFEKTPGPITINSGGVEVTMQPRSIEENDIQVSSAVRVPGFQSIIVSEDSPTSAAHPRWIGVGKLSAQDPVPSVLLGGYTGGAHCCATLKAIIPDGDRLRVLDFPQRDGGPEEAFPRDIDGDGTVDIVLQDDRFRYAFASGAGSWSPPVIYNVYRGQIIDLTTQRSYRPLWESYAQKAKLACSDKNNNDRNGACAAYVAASARLQRHSTAMLEVEALAAPPDDFLPSGCRVVEADGVCPKGEEIKFVAFTPALTWFLRVNGYTD